MTRDDVAATLEYVRFRDWKFSVGEVEGKMYMQVAFSAECSKTGEAEDWTGRRWWLPSSVDRSGVVQTALKAVLTAVEHEAREDFSYCRRAIFSPHHDVDRLWSITE